MFEICMFSTLKGQGQNWTLWNVTLRSSRVKTGKNTHHSMRLDELNAMRARAVNLFFFSVRSLQKHAMTSSDLV